MDILDSHRIPVSSTERAKREKIYPYYGAQGVVDYIDNYIFDGEYVLVAEDGSNLKTLNEPIVTWAKGKFWVNNHAHILGSNGKSNLRFIYYYLMASDLRGLITGSAQPKLNQDNLSTFQISLPAKQMQDAIAQILGAIDDKIEANKRLVRELEETARLIYDYWFTQFDFPDENGKPYRSSGGKMVWSEELRREIPVGWNVVALNDIVGFEKGTSYKSEDLFGEGIPMLNLASFNVDGTYKSNGLKNYSGRIDPSKTVSPFDLVICLTQQTAIDLTGETNIIGKAFLVPDIFDSEVIISTDVAKLIAVDNHFVPMLHGLLSKSFIHKYIVGYANGTKIKHLDLTGAFGLRMPVPSLNSNILAQYESVCKYIFSLTSKLLRENHHLLELRDWLLTMLMNGQAIVCE